MRSGQNQLRRDSQLRCDKAGRRAGKLRGGSTLIVVVGMLGLLLLLGFTFFTFANQENTSAEFFSEAAKEATPALADFDYAIEQLVLGARGDRPNSALYAGGPLSRHSLLVNMLGNDTAPFTGEGINLTFTDANADGLPDASGANFPWGVDRNYNGIPDGTGGDTGAGLNQDWLNINYSALANPVSGGDRRNPPTDIPSPDVDYTYPDINNLFLAYYGTTWDAEAQQWRRYIIPSFHRPQYLRDTTTGLPIANWMTNATTKARVFRPHPEHIVKSPTTGATRYRYIRSTDPVVNDALGSPIGAFPFGGMRQGIFDAASGTTAARDNAEFTSFTRAATLTAANSSGAIAYDTDNDNDGTKEGVWLDLDSPVQRLSDGRLYTCLYSFTIIDADGLINLNEAGNLAGAGSSAGDIQKGLLLGSAQTVSRSNLGLSPSEINPQYALDANPYVTGNNKVDFDTNTDANTALDPHRLMWNLPGGINSGLFPWGTSGAQLAPISRVNLSNMELAMMLLGRTTYRAQLGGGLTVNGVEYALSDTLAGRWGEADRIRIAAWEAGTGSRANYPQSFRFTSNANFAPGLSLLFPRPGLSFGDVPDPMDSTRPYHINRFLTGNPSGLFWPYSPPDPIAGRFTPFNIWANAGGPSNYDDNNNRYAGNPWGNSSTFLPNITLPANRTPLDLRGSGSFTTVRDTLSANVIGPNGPVSRLIERTGAVLPGRWTVFNGYAGPRSNPNDAFNPDAPVTPWETALATGTLSTGVNESAGVDEPGETVTEPRYSRNRGDEIFSMDSMAGLHLRESETKALTGGEERLRQLLPVNFAANNRRDKTYLNTVDAAEWPKGIRDRFTVSSWDRSQFNRPFRSDRSWEFRIDPELSNEMSRRLGSTDVVNQRINRTCFPPWFGGIGPKTPAAVGEIWNKAGFLRSNVQPFRPELRNVLRIQQSQLDSDRQYRLNMNRLLISYFDTSLGQAVPTYRPLMPHPVSNLTSATLPTRSQMLGPNLAPGRLLEKDGRGNITDGDDNGNYVADDFDTNDGSTSTTPGEVDWTELGAPYSDDLMPWSPVADITAAGLPGGAQEAESRAAIQEFWARRDRQLMARDVYVMLYTLGGGVATDAAQVSNWQPNPMPPPTEITTIFTVDQMREMAQFAVNYVDSLDADDVITRFEYDLDLSDGWNLDDNAYDATGETAARRGVVDGVEMQQLTFSELLAIRVPRISFASPDSTVTTFDDRNDSGDTLPARYFGYLELRNASPYPVNFSNSGYPAWRIRRVDPTDTNITLSVLTLGTNALAGNPLAGGEQMTIGTRSYIPDSPPSTPQKDDPDPNGNNGRPSFFRVNSGAGTYDLIAPASKATTSALDLASTATEASGAQVASELPNYLDLVWSPHAARFTLTDNAGVALQTGDFLNSGNPGDRLRFVLERRANPNRTSAASTTENPWIAVDELDVDQAIQNFNVNGTLASELSNLRSHERAHPFNRPTTGLGVPNSNGISASVLNTLSGAPVSLLTSWGGAMSNLVRNSNSSTTGFPVTQMHLDRDFTSPMELLSLPLFGPADVTRYHKLTLDMRNQMVNGSNEVTGAEFVAAKKFLRPDFGVTLPGALDTFSLATNPVFDNRWYRILEQLEVPAGRNVQVQPFLTSPRTPGKINLNTIRDVSVLAALLDDPTMINGTTPAPGATGWPFGLLTGAIDTNTPAFDFESGTRSWWTQFAKARDQRDPITGLYLPGMPNSRPFRSLGYLGSNTSRIESGIERTVLRAMAVNNTNGLNMPVPPADYRDIDLDTDLSGPSGTPDGVIDGFDDAVRGDKRQLFEARTVNDLGSQGTGTSNTVDVQTRHRLLAKVANNSTTRSNVFIVWASVGFFKAYYDTTAQVYRIGEELDTSEFPRERAFFVLDRTEFERAYDRRTGTFNFRKFIKYRKTLTD